jgi:hypothetical protein
MFPLTRPHWWRVVAILDAVRDNDKQVARYVLQFFCRGYRLLRARVKLKTDGGVYEMCRLSRT